MNIREQQRLNRIIAIEVAIRKAGIDNIIFKEFIRVVASDYGVCFRTAREYIETAMIRIKK